MTPVFALALVAGAFFMPKKSRKVHNMPVINGEIHPRAKLTATQVRAVRQSYEPGRVTMLDLAERYGVTKQAISSIVNRLSWHHLRHEGPVGPARDT